MGLLFDRDYTKEFQRVGNEISLVRNAVRHSTEDISILADKIDALQKDMELIKSVLIEPEQKTIELKDIPTELIRPVGKARQKWYSKIKYHNFEFITKNEPSFDISDVLKLSVLIDNFEDYPTVAKLRQAVLPNKAVTTFERMLYNYQRGFFEDYLKEYIENTTFTVQNGLLCINGLNTGLTTNQVLEMTTILNNNSEHDKYNCIDKFVKQYSTHKAKYIKIICDFAGSYALERTMKLPKKNIKIENNPQKRKENRL